MNNYLPLIGMAVGLVLGLGLWAVRSRPKARHFEPTLDGHRVEVDPDDPSDCMHDPAVREMLAEVFRTGRPMQMNRGEAATFVDDEEPALLPSEKRSKL